MKKKLNEPYSKKNTSLNYILAADSRCRKEQRQHRLLQCLLFDATSFHVEFDRLSEFPLQDFSLLRVVLPASKQLTTVSRGALTDRTREASGLEAFATVSQTVYQIL